MKMRVGANVMNVNVDNKDNLEQCLENFRALKTFTLANNFYGQKIAESGDFLCPKTLLFREF